jgi:16S rRNA (cytosine1402-N4)-methyltransferase
MTDTDNLHKPVLLQESIDSLQLSVGMTVVDCTVNRAGHAELIAKAIGKEGRLIIFDLDKEALGFSTKKLTSLGDAPEIIPIHANYREIAERLSALGIGQVNAIFADLGLSSQEIEISGRGFTFQKDEPLLMTLQSEVTDDTLTAKDLLQNLSIEQLTNIFKNYGEEQQAYSIAKAIVARREEGLVIDTTSKLVEVILSVTGERRWSKTHPATKIFQALRIAVNDEYGGVVDLIDQSKNLLVEGGVLSIISFHSGEDRIVKEKMKDLQAEGGWGKPKKQKPSPEEIKNNKRSRSAILRTIIKTK